MIKKSLSRNYVQIAFSTVTFAMLLALTVRANEAAALQTLKDAKVGDWAVYEINSDAKTVRIRNTVTHADSDKVTIQTAVLNDSGEATSFTSFETRRDAPYGPAAELKSAEKLSERESKHRIGTADLTATRTEFRSADKTIAVEVSPQVPFGGLVKVENKDRISSSTQTLTSFGGKTSDSKP